MLSHPPRSIDHSPRSIRQGAGTALLSRPSSRTKGRPSATWRGGGRWGREGRGGRSRTCLGIWRKPVSGCFSSAYIKTYNSTRLPRHVHRSTANSARAAQGDVNLHELLQPADVEPGPCRSVQANPNGIPGRTVRTSSWCTSGAPVEPGLASCSVLGCGLELRVRTEFNLCLLEVSMGGPNTVNFGHIR